MTFLKKMQVLFSTFFASLFSPKFSTSVKNFPVILPNKDFSKTEQSEFSGVAKNRTNGVDFLYRLWYN